MIKQSLVRTTRSIIIESVLYDVDIEFTKSFKLFGITVWTRYYKTIGDVSTLNNKRPIGLQQHEKTN